MKDNSFWEKAVWLGGLFTLFLPPATTAFAQTTAQEGAKPINLEQIVVSATKTEHTLGDVPVATEVVTAEEMEQKQIRTVADALKYVSGLTIGKTSSSWGNKGNVGIQGMDDAFTLVLVDGQRYLGGHGGGVDVHSIPTQMVERVEIIKGPASSLYGSDAMGGVVNIITKKAGKKPTAAISSSFGSRNTWVQEATGGVTVDKFSGLVGYTYRQSDGIVKETDAYNENLFEGNFGYDFNPDSKLTFRPYYSEHKMDSEGRRQERTGLNTAWEWKPDGLSKLNIRGAAFDYNHYTRSRSTDWDENSYEGEATYSRLLFERHLVTTGYQYFLDEVDDKGKSYKANQDLHSFYLQDEMNLSPFVVVLGTRLDHHDHWGSEWNPKLNVMYEIMKDLKIRGSIGSAFKGPDLVKLYAEGWRMGPYLVHANPSLQPEESIGYQLELEYGFLKRFIGKVSVFRNDIENLITYTIKKAGPPPWGMYWVNVGEAVVQGVEMSVSGNLTDTLFARLNYLRLDTEDKTTGRDLTYRARDKVSLELNKKFPEIGLTVNVAGQYVGRRYDSTYNRLGGYALCDIAVTKAIGRHLDIFAKADNIFGKKGVEDEYDLDGETFLAGITIRY